MKSFIPIAALTISLFATHALAGVEAEIEASVVFTSRNDAAIPHVSDEALVTDQLAARPDKTSDQIEDLRFDMHFFAGPAQNTGFQIEFGVCKGEAHFSTLRGTSAHLKLYEAFLHVSKGSLKLGFKQAGSERRIVVLRKDGGPHVRHYQHSPPR